MNTKEAILGLIRHILTFGGGYAASAGLASADDITAITAGVVAIVGVLWSVFSKKNA